mgnify:FL=1|tara:strand:+ start:396 stop:1556 length:1161 start_codon:yes stop_codon:yes gene_type:complete
MSYIGNDPNQSGTSTTLTVQDEGSSLSTSATTLNFTGSGVTASGTGSTKTINISGGGGGGGLTGNFTGDISSAGYSLSFADATGGTSNGYSPTDDVINLGSSNDMQIFHNSREGSGFNIIKNNNQMDLKIVDDGYTEMALFERWGKVALRNDGRNCIETARDTNNYGTVKIGGGTGSTPYTLAGTIGTAGQVLQVPSSGTELEWATPSGGGGGGGGYDWEHISDEHLGGNAVGGSGGAGYQQATIVDISSYKNVRVRCWDYSSSGSDVYGLIALVTTNSASGSGVATEGYAQQWNWVGSMYHGSATGNTSNGFQVFGQATSHDGNGAINTLHLYGLDQTKVYYECTSVGMYNGIVANGAGFTTSGSSSWYLFFKGNVQAWQIAGSK